MWLIKKSRKGTFVCTNYKEQRVSIPKSKEKLKEMEDDDEDIFMTSIHDRYAARPNDKEAMCLAKFAVSYDVVCSQNKDQDDQYPLDHESDIGILDDDIHNDNNQIEDSGGSGKSKKEVIQLKTELGFMRKRKRESVLRTNKVKLTVDPEKYYHSFLMLFFPWSSEENLKGTFETYEEQYKSNRNIVDHNASHFNHNSDHLDNAIDALTKNGSPKTSRDTVAPMIEEENINAQQNGYHVHQGGDDDIDTSKHNVCAETDKYKSCLSMQYTMEACKDIMSASEYRECIRKLNPG